jgi:hypothetical protein
MQDSWYPVELQKLIDEYNSVLRINPHQKHIDEHDEFKQVCLQRLISQEINLDMYRELIAEHGFKKIRDIGWEVIMNTELEIGGTQFDKDYGVFLDIWYEIDNDGTQGYKFELDALSETK